MVAFHETFPSNIYEYFVCLSYFKFSIIFLFICTLFIDALNNSDYIEQNYWMTANLNHLPQSVICIMRDLVLN
jgi:hypothetical protein